MSQDETPVDAGAEAPAGPALAPITAAQRLDVMDILRGLALIGILLMNIEWFNRSITELGSFDDTLTGIDYAAGWLVRCFVEGKFYKLFALLFGMGFAVMLIRAQEAGRPFTAWFVRRMLVLWVIGMLHFVFLFTGDILHDYAFAGLLLLGWVLLFRRPRLQRFNTPRHFLRIGLVWMFLPFIVVTFLGIGFGALHPTGALEEQWAERREVVALADAELAQPAPPDEDSADEVDNEDEIDEDSIEAKVARRVKNKRTKEQDRQDEAAAYTSPSYWVASVYRATAAPKVLALSPMFALLVLMPIFLVGYWFVASGVLKNHREHRHIFRPMAIIGMTLGLALTVSGMTVLEYPHEQLPWHLVLAGQITFVVGQFILSAGYLGTVVLLTERERVQRWLMRFAPMGRMALTNYIMHSLVLMLIFQGFAGGMYGQIPRGPQMLIVAAIILAQMFLSAWWLERYRFGPLEWVWRSLTYKSWQPMRITRA